MKKSPANTDTKGTEAAQDKKQGKSNKALTIVGIIMCVILVPFLVMNVTMIIKSYAEPDKVPSVFGVSPMIVLSPSMEDTIKSGDMIFIKEADTDAIEVGDIISFYTPKDYRRNGDYEVTTHRVIGIIEVKEDKDHNKYIEKTTESGMATSDQIPSSIKKDTDNLKKRYFLTKGDNNMGKDGDPWNLTDVLADTDVVGIYMFRVPYAGTVANFMHTTPGLIICIGVPIVLLVGYDLIMKKRFDKKKKKDTDALLAELEELRAQKAGEDAQPAAEPKKSDEPKADAPAPAEATAEKPVNEVTSEDKNS